MDSFRLLKVRNRTNALRLFNIRTNAQVSVVRRSVFLALAVCLAGMIPLSALAAGGKTDAFAAVAAKKPITLDGKLGDPQWQNALVARDFYDVSTRQPALPTLATTAYILYDADSLYVGFVCDQTSVPLTANQTTNDVGEGLDDQVEINIDTSGNGTRIYTFRTTPRGIRYQESSESSRFAPRWRAAASMRKGGWSAEMAIPLKNLRAPAGAVQTWRVNLQRHVAAKDQDFSWAYDPRMSGPDDSLYWPALTGLHVGTMSTRPLPYADIYGLASAGSDRAQFQQSSGLFGFQNVRYIGADGTYPFTNTLSFVGTYNPDFSNVEVDQQIIAPQQFQRAFVEYRPFFAQGSSYLTPGFQFSINGPPNLVFYSPSIGTFNWGSKVEGTVGSNAIGLLDIGGPGFNDQAFGFNHRSPAQDFSYFLDGVFAHHTSDGSSVSPCPIGLLKCRDSSYEFGLRKSDLASGWQSALDYSAESGDYVSNPALAHSFFGVVSRVRPFSEFDFGFRDIGPQYSPVDGFTLLSDLRGPFFVASFNGYSMPNTAVKRYEGYFAAERYLDRSSAVQYAEMSGNVTVTFKNLMSFNVGPTISELRTSSGYPDYAAAQTLPYNQTNVGFGIAQGTASPTNVSYSWGPFAALCSVPPSATSPNALFCGPYPNLNAPFYLQQLDASTSRQLGVRFNVSAEVGGSIERPYAGPADGQWLRRFSIGASLGPNANLSLSLRSISGTGGFALPGLNFATSFHNRFPSGSELYVNFGSPASPITLNRLIVKFILHVGQGSTGT